MKKIYIIMMLVVSVLLIQCCAQKQQVKEKSIEVESERVIIDEEETEEIYYEHLEEVEMSAPDEYEYNDRTPASSEELIEEVVVEASAPMETIEYQIIPDTITVQKYELGRIVYDIPDEMEKLTTYHIVVNIARDTLDVRIYEGVPNVSVDTIIRTSKVMQVELLDPTGDFFKIVSDTERQFIEIDEHTTWNFYVTPQKTGESKLILNVSILKDGNLKQKSYGDVVVVNSKPTLEIKLWIQKYWQWAFGVFIIPLFAYIKKKFFTKKPK